MSDLRSRLTSCGSAAALGVALVTTTSFHQWTTSKVGHDTMQQDNPAASQTMRDGAEGRQASPAVTKISFSPNAFHHFP